HLRRAAVYPIEKNTRAEFRHGPVSMTERRRYDPHDLTRSNKSPPLPPFAAIRSLRRAVVRPPRRVYFSDALSNVDPSAGDLPRTPAARRVRAGRERDGARSSAAASGFVSGPGGERRTL